MANNKSAADGRSDGFVWTVGARGQATVFARPFFQGEWVRVEGCDGDEIECVSTERDGVRGRVDVSNVEPAGSDYFVPRLPPGASHAEAPSVQVILDAPDATILDLVESPRFAALAISPDFPGGPVVIEGGAVLPPHGCPAIVTCDRTQPGALEMLLAADAAGYYVRTLTADERGICIYCGRKGGCRCAEGEV